MAYARPSGVIAPLAALAPLAGLALGLGGVSPSAAVAAPSFTLVPGVLSPQGTTHSRIRALSDDGRSAAGISLTGSGPGFLWTADGGRNDFGLGIPFGTDCFGISNNGLTVVGRSVGPRAFRWSEAGGYQSLGTLAGYAQSEARDANYDGSIVVGTVHNGSGTGTQAFRWTEAGGMQGLGGGTEARAISRDGSTIVGRFGTAPNAFRWTQDGGLQFLPALGGEGGSLALDVNFDGSVIVGRSGTNFRPTMWLNGSPQELAGGASTSISFHPLAVSDNGSVVAGDGQSTLNGQQRASIWTPETGTLWLADYLSMNGVSLPAGIELSACTAISADGLTFAGYTANGPYGIQGYVATIPTPGSLLLVGGIGLLTVRRRR